MSHGYMYAFAESHHMSRDVVFEEGVGHRTTDVALEQDDLDVSFMEEFDEPLPAPAATPVKPDDDDDIVEIISPATLPSTADEPTAPLPAADHDAPPPPAPDAQPRPRIQYPPASRRSGRLAGDDPLPFDPDRTLALVARGSDEHWIPKSYLEAMQRPDLWMGPMVAEMAMMKAMGVWKLTERPKVNDTGNPWVPRGRPVPIPAKNRTREHGRLSSRPPGPWYHPPSLSALTTAAVVVVESLVASAMLSAVVALSAVVVHPPGMGWEWAGRLLSAAMVDGGWEWRMSTPSSAVSCKGGSDGVDRRNLRRTCWISRSRVFLLLSKPPPSSRVIRHCPRSSWLTRRPPSSRPTSLIEGEGHAAVKKGG
ncbi:hypothetical protein BJ912DRAFT_926536 [Pholiota molesta]|nr:hypothetical protein BJ912DRAFT_926536 [Pholiota molesta]